MILQKKSEIEAFYKTIKLGKSRSKPSVISAIVQRINHVYKMFSTNACLYVYTDGYYMELEKEIFKKIIMNLFITGRYVYSNREGSDAYSQMRTICSVTDIDKKMNNYPDLIPFKNGYFNIKTNKFEACRKSVYFTTHLPFDYNKSPKCPLFKRTVEEILPNKDDRDYLLTYIKYCFSSSIERGIALILYGESGENGKTSLIEYFLSMLGDLATPFDFHALSKDSGTITSTNGKFFALASEIGRTGFLEVSTQERIKNMITDSHLSGRGAYQVQQNWINTTKYIFTTNRFPKLADPQRAFFRRFKIIEFTQIFTDDSTIKKDRTRFKRIMDTENGDVLSWILQNYSDISILTTDWKEIKEFWIDKSSPVKRFVEDCCEVKYIGVIEDTTSDMYEAFVDWCGDQDVNVIKMDTFKKNMKKLGHRTEQIEGKTWIYKGVKLL